MRYGSRLANKVADRVRPKLLQERVFDELEPLFDRLADMTRYFVRILSLVMKDGTVSCLDRRPCIELKPVDIATKTLNRIAPAIKALLCDGSDNGTVISALSYTRSWLEHSMSSTVLQALGTLTIW